MEKRDWHVMHSNSIWLGLLTPEKHMWGENRQNRIG